LLKKRAGLFAAYLTGWFMILLIQPVVLPHFLRR